VSGWAIINEREAAPEPVPVSIERAALLGIAPAPTGRRALAAVIDAIPPVLFAVPLPFAVPALVAGELWGILVTAICVLLIAVYALVQLASHGRRGQTFGKQMMRIRTLRADSLGPIGFGRAFVRALAIAASGVVPVVGPAVMLLSPLWDVEQRRRGWHDHASRAWLIDLDAVDPTDPVAFEAARGRARVRSVALGATPAAASPPAPSAPARAVEPVREAVSPAPVGHPAPVGEALPPLAPHDAAAPAQPAARAHLRFDTGEVLAVHGAALVGRAPTASGDEVVMHLMPIADETRSISKTHFALGADEHGLLVSDRGSTNGTAIERGGATIPVSPGAAARLAPGDRIRFGDRFADVL
jgi:uncharacterized RDD family membrane protein YckC